MSRTNGVEERKAEPRRPKGDLVVDDFKAFRQIMTHLTDWYENGVNASKEYTLDVMDLPEEDEIELKRYLRSDPARSEGSLVQDMYVRLRDRALRMGMLHIKVKVKREGTRIWLLPSNGEQRKKRQRWKFVKV